MITNWFQYSYRRFLGLAFLLFLVFSGARLSGQDASSEFVELRRIIEAQKEQIQAQKEQIERQQHQLEAIDRKLETLVQSAGLRPQVNLDADLAAHNQIASTAGASSAIASALFATAPITTKSDDRIAVAAQSPAPSIEPASGKPPTIQIPAAKAEAPKKWYEKYALRGYTQLRTNRIFADNPRFLCEQCDRSIGANNNLLVRRARLVLSGDINDRVSIYFQPDFASSSGTLHFGQIRDLYFDVYLDKKKEFRMRFGQSKIPFGFENLQSSQNRLALDRGDPLNSSLPNERDLGAFFYWAPDHIRKRFAHLVSSGLKGSGDYGVFGAGVYNGQTANKAEANNNMHVVTRLSYPFELKNKQIVEAGIQAYSGRYTVTSDQRTPTTLGPSTFADRRYAASVVLYPQPFGVQAEYNFGVGPRFNPRTRTIEPHHLNGGYIQAMYMRRFRGQILTPYVRYQYYDGGKKAETDARLYLVKSLEAGVEWQTSPFMEWTAEFVHGNRTFEDARLPFNVQTGNLLRLQLQINY